MSLLGKGKLLLSLMGLILFNSFFFSNAWGGAQRPATPSISAPSTSTTGSFVISWGGVFGGDRYEIRQTGSASRNYSTSGTSLSISGLADGSYTFSVRACTDDWRRFSEECGYYSIPSAITVQRPPGVPSSLSVPASDGDGSFSLSWGAASGSSINYYLYESKNYAGYVLVYSGTSLSTSLSGRGDGHYRYAVRAYNSIGGWGDYRYGNQALNVLLIPSTPGIVTVPVGVVQLDNYYISWGAASGSVARYEYQASANNGASYGGWINNGSSTRVDFNSGQSDYEGQHRYQVRACNASGCGAIRTSGSVSVYKIPSAPPTVTVPNNASGSGYTISWGSSTGTVSDYQVRQEYNGNWSGWVSMGTAFSKGYSLNFGGQVRNEVRACNPAGCSNGKVSDYYSVFTDSICGVIPSNKSGFEMTNISAMPTSINSFHIGYNYMIDISVESGPGHNNPPTEFLIQQNSGGGFYDIARVSGDDGFTVTDLPVGNYQFRVQGISSYTCASNILAISRTVHGVPPTPETFESPNVVNTPAKLSCGANSFEVEWPATNGANQYQLEMRSASTAVTDFTVNETIWSEWSTFQGSEVLETQSFTHQGLVAGSSYQYRVKARYKLNNYDIYTNWSDWRESSKVRRPHCVPAAPSKVTGTTEAQYPSSTDSSILTHLDRDGDFQVQWLYTNAAQEPLVGYYEVQRYGTKVSPPPESDRLLNKTFQVNEMVGGIYRYDVVACNVDGCSEPSDYLEVTVALPAEPPSLPLAFDYVADPDTYASVTPFEGLLTGSLSVTPSGAASYSVPITMPPGTAGIAPNLSIDYSSQAGKGLLGGGWSLGGLSMITRCPKTLAQDQERGSVKYDSNDRFCLDGKRLVVVEGHYGEPGSVYRTELDSFDIVTAKGTKGSGPAWFEIKTKSGEVLEYGNTADSQIEASGKETVAIWAMNRVEDTVSNYYTVDYYENAEGEFYPTAFNYTGNTNEGISPYATINLIYEDRPDARVAYYLGSKTTQAKRLKKIVTAIGEYQLEYAAETDFQASRIEAIQYCDANNHCPDTRRLTFEWQENNGQEGWADVILEDQRGGTFVGYHGYSMHKSFVDIDGDGNIELISGRPGGHSEVEIPCSSICDPHEPPETELVFQPDVLSVASTQGLTGFTWEEYPGSKPAVSPYKTQFDDPETGVNEFGTDDAGVRFVDLNGDGFVDILKGWDTDLRAWLHGENKGDGWTLSTAYTPPEPFVDAEGDDAGTRILDLNGDGLPDILRMQITGGHSSWINTGNGWVQDNSWAISQYSIAMYAEQGRDEGARFADLNGDGLVDMMLWRSYGDPNDPGSHSNWHSYANYNYHQRLTYINTGSGFELDESNYTPPDNVHFISAYGHDQGLRIVDINGDGLPDLVKAIAGFAPELPFKTWLNTGTGWVESIEYRMPIPIIQFYEVSPNVSATYSDTGLRFLDVNGDGLTDIMQGGRDGTGRFILNTGQGWNSVYGPYVPKAPIVLDQELEPYNPNNVRDAGVRFADINSDGMVDFVSHQVYYNQAKPLLITGVTDGLGNKQVVRYKPLTDPEVYEMENNVYGAHEHDIGSAMPVVHQIDMPDGCGDPQTQEYFYKGLVINTQGLGSYGFREITQTSLINHYSTVTTYHQEYPYVGIPESSISKTDTGVIVTETHTRLIDLDYKNPLGTNHGFIVKGNVYDGIDETEKVYVPVFPYVKHTETTVHHLNNAMEAIGTSVTTRTDTEYDNAYGNATKITTVVDDNQGKSWTTVTDNEYGRGNIEHERMGRLTYLRVEKSVAGEASQRETEFYYDSTSHLLVKEVVEPNRTEPETLATVYGHDGFGNRTSVTVCAKDIGACDVDSIGPADLPHRTTKTSYDPVDYPSTHPYTSTGTRGRYPVVITNAKGHHESFRYDEDFGVKTKQTGPNGISACFEYDSWGRKTKERSLCGSTTETQTITEYNKATAYTEYAQYTVSSYIEGREHGTTVRAYFDVVGNKLRTQKRGFKGQMIYVDYTYDDRGRPRKVSEPYFYTYEYEPVIYWNETKVIDELGRIQEAIQPVGDITYDPGNGEVAGNPEPPVHLYTTYKGFETHNADVNGRVKVTYNNAIGQTTKTIDAYLTAVQSQLTFGYDSQGNQVTTTDDAGNVIELGYDIRGHKIWMKDPDMGKHVGTQWTYVYNGYGELTSQIDAKGQTTQMQYDTLGRMIERTDLYGTANAQTSTWIYDTAPGAGIGKLHTETGLYASKSHIYDDNGRLTHTTEILTTATDIGSFTTEWRYDELGRRTHVKYPEIDANTPRVWMNYQYNEFGYLHYMLDITDPSNPAGIVYWRADEVNARGQLEDERMRNRTRTQQYHNEANGWLDATFTMDGTTSEMDVPIEDNLIQHTHYRYDVSGNVQEKTGRANGLDNFRTDLTEHYSYDELNRLTSSGITGYDVETGEPFGVGEKENYPVKNYQYDVLGNMTRKDGLGDYYYGNNCENGGAGPHAVCEIRSDNIVMKSYQYDANGAMTHSYLGATPTDGTTTNLEREITYNGFNKPSRIVDNSRTNQTTAEFYYGPNRSRVLRIADELKYDNSNSETLERERIAYIGHGATGGTIMERKTNETTGKVTYIHFMYAGGYHNGQAFAMRVIEHQAGVSIYVGTEYYHRDHLGSVIAITDDTGLKRAYADDGQGNQTEGGAHAFLKGYDAWGKRRNPNWSEEPGGESQYTSTRGHLSYTGQEAVTGVGLIHMNGRLYDPELGRFISADPIIQAPNYTQSYNRYSYVWNNPVNSIDPSGYSLKRLTFKPLTKISPELASAISIALNYVPYCQVWCSAVFNAAYAKANGANSFQIVSSFVIGAVSSGAGYNSAVAAGFEVTSKGALATAGGAMFSGMVSGALSGAINASLAGENVRRGMFKGAAQGAVMSAMTWGIQNSISSRTMQKKVDINGTPIEGIGFMSEDGVWYGYGDTLDTRLAYEDTDYILNMMRAAAAEGRMAAGVLQIAAGKSLCLASGCTLGGTLMIQGVGNIGGGLSDYLSIYGIQSDLNVTARLYDTILPGHGKQAFFAIDIVSGAAGLKHGLEKIPAVMSADKSIKIPIVIEAGVKSAGAYKTVPRFMIEGTPLPAMLNDAAQIGSSTDSLIQD